MAVAFVYAKNGKVKVLGEETDKAEENVLLRRGWSHTATLDARAWIQHIINSKTQIEDINSLKHKP